MCVSWGWEQVGMESVRSSKTEVSRTGEYSQKVLNNSCLGRATLSKCHRHVECGNLITLKLFKIEAIA